MSSPVAACSACTSAFDGEVHTPLRTPCCRRFVCCKCVNVACAQPSTPRCWFCDKACGGSLEAYAVDGAVLDYALAHAPVDDTCPAYVG